MDLFVKVAYDDSSVDKGIDGTSKKGSGFATKLGKAFKGVGAAVVAISTAAIALGTAFVKGAMDVSDYGSNVNDMSQKLNLSTKGFQEWSYILGQSGVDIGVLQTGLKTLSSAAVDGNEAFTKLGISQEELSTLSTEDLFNKTIAQLSQMEAGTERTALASDLFGRSATELMPILNAGAGSLEEMRKQAEDYGLVMSDEAVKASDDFGDSVSLMQQTLTGMKNRMIGDFLPSLTLVTDGLAKLFTGDTNGLDGINQGLSDFVGKIAEATPQIVEVGGSILQALATAIITNLPMLVQSALALVSQLGMFIIQNLPLLVQAALDILVALATGIAEQLPTLIPTIVQTMLTIVDTLIQNIPMLIEASIQLMTGLANGIIAALPLLVERIPELILALVDGIVANLPALLTASVQIIVQLAQGILTAIPQLLEAVPEIISSLVQAFGELAPELWAAGEDLIAGLWQGISNAGTWLWEKIKGFGQSVIDNIKGVFGIESPSTVMREQVGKQISAGIGEGISDNEGAVTDATDSLADSVLGGADLSEVGAALVDTLGSGMLGKIADAVADFIDGLVTALHNSMIPVLAMFSELGGLFVQRLIGGMEGHRTQIVSEAIQLAQAANAAFFGALQPTVRQGAISGYGSTEYNPFYGNTGYNPAGGVTVNNQFYVPVTSPTQMRKQIEQTILGAIYGNP